LALSLSFIQTASCLSWRGTTLKTSRAVVAIVILAGLGVLLSAPAGWAKKHPKKQKDTGRFSEQCLVDDKNLSDGATISIAPASLWPPNHKFANVAVGMNLNSDADDPVPVSFSIISITDDQAEDDDQGGHGCGQKSSKQGPDWAPTGLSDSDPLTVSGSLKKSSDVIGTDPGEVKLRRERC